MFTTRFQAWVRGLALRGAERLRRLPVTPNQITIVGFLVTVVAAIFVALDHPFTGGLVLLFAGAFDIFDGALARASGRSYPYGAFLDSTTDRFSEGAIMVGLAIYLQRHGIWVGPILVVIATAGSLLVSYVKARALSLGFTCDGGLLARPERVLLTVVGLLLTPLSDAGLVVVVGILAIFTTLTVVQRMWSVWRQSQAARAATDGSGPTTDAAAAGQVPPAAGPSAPATAPARPPAPGGEPRPERDVRPGPEPAGG